ncbi:MAG: hypothetical protein IJX84_08590 [Clostridia bacterium]|nr:hypothetical protein [Clostridia bacterium]
MTKEKSYYSPAQNKATQKYLQEKRQQVRFWVRKGELDDLQAEAESTGMSMAAYVIKAVNDLADRQILTPPEKGQGRKRAVEVKEEE